MYTILYSGAPGPPPRSSRFDPGLPSPPEPSAIPRRPAPAPRGRHRAPHRASRLPGLLRAPSRLASRQGRDAARMRMHARAPRGPPRTRVADRAIRSLPAPRCAPQRLPTDPHVAQVTAARLPPHGPPDTPRHPAPHPAEARACSWLNSSLAALLGPVHARQGRWAAAGNMIHDVMYV